jgi:protein TonB
MKKASKLSGIKDFFNGTKTQASLFHYVKTEQEVAQEKLSWQEIAALIRPDFKEPETQASLFHYVKPKEESNGAEEVHVSPEILERLAQRPKGFEPGLIPSLFVDYAELNEDIRAMSRRTRLTAGASVLLHILVLGFVVFLLINKGANEPPVKQEKETLVMLTPNLPPMVYEHKGPSRQGGGGGGGGRLEPTPPSHGRLPKTSTQQLVPPDPRPIESHNTDLIAEQTIVVPVNIPQDQTLPIGDITSAPAPTSSGPGKGPGIGTGAGSGVGPGRGPGFGPGSGGGAGGGTGGGFGPGVGPGVYTMGMAGIRNPECIYQTLPEYTEEARRLKVTGVVVLQVIIRSSGKVDNPRVVRGLGHGLDESAIEAVMTKWRFKPGTKDGSPVDVIANIEVLYNLL